LNDDITDLGVDRGHRTLRIVRKGGKRVTIPLAPRTARAVDLYVGERAGGPIFIGATGDRLSRHAADRTVKRLARRAGVIKRISPHSLRHLFITAALDAGVPLRDVQRPPHTRTRAPRCDTTEAARASTDTPPTRSRLYRRRGPPRMTNWSGDTERRHRPTAPDIAGLGSGTGRHYRRVTSAIGGGGIGRAPNVRTRSRLLTWSRRSG
jgi:hypothetical protein